MPCLKWCRENSYWFAYERMLTYYARRSELQCDVDASMGELSVCATTPVPASAHFVAGAVSGSMAAVLTHPFEVLKTRRQLGEGTGAVAIARSIWARDGTKGFTRGMAGECVGCS
jgi:hypothetical protein